MLDDIRTDVALAVMDFIMCYATETPPEQAQDVHARIPTHNVARAKEANCQCSDTRKALQKFDCLHLTLA